MSLSTTESKCDRHQSKQEVGPVCNGFICMTNNSRVPEEVAIHYNFSGSNRVNFVVLVSGNRGIVNAQ